MLRHATDKLARQEQARPLERRSRRRRRARCSRTVSIVGVVLICLGTIALTYVGWQFYGTNWVARREHREITSDLQRAWDEGNAGVDARGSTATALIRIPRFGQKYEVPLLEGTTDDVLAAGFGHFRGTTQPGGKGNFAIAAHRVTHGEPLRKMPDLRPGDKIVVETAEARFTYELDTGGDDLVVPMTDTWVVQRRPTNPDTNEPPAEPPNRKLITITTCAELFHTDDRMVAFGHLVDVAAVSR